MLASSNFFPLLRQTICIPLNSYRVGRVCTAVLCITKTPKVCNALIIKAMAWVLDSVSGWAWWRCRIHIIPPLHTSRNQCWLLPSKTNAGLWQFQFWLIESVFFSPRTMKAIQIPINTGKTGWQKRTQALQVLSLQGFGRFFWSDNLAGVGWRNPATR